ncbi:prolyl 4-hydroxylase [Apostasia shenzhenica]|uniref:Prolyl 4-hydroxylase n=1 Tax=Apostasia shenzhenica TaxID=1088818 RepID=A0A2I0AAH1_9ASPA|nr:prolyl 4-hydroxylase [Apostasia shenzhenica]
MFFERGQKCEPHPDFFDDKFNQERGGNRMATVIMYLSNITRGGETVFPLSEVSS